MFSVIIPLYNKSQYILRAIDSVFCQSYGEYEVIVVNDGSTDGGEKRVMEKFGDRVILFHQKNQGVSSARNNGIKKAQFDRIAFLDADDYWHPDYLKFVTKVIKNHPEVGIIGTRYNSEVLSTDPTLDYYKLDNYFKRAVRNAMYFTSATVVRKDFFDRNPGFDPNIKLGEDIDVWLRASIFFGDGYYINNKLVYYGQEDENRATQKLYALEETLIPKITATGYYTDSTSINSIQKKQFFEFMEKWVYFTLFSLYALPANKKPIKIIMQRLPGRFLLVRGFYLLPFSLMRKIFSIPSLSGLFRNYMKFCFRYIYT
jgi:glycosyltransferase involved in cell wall biosynthesis